MALAAEILKEHKVRKTSIRLQVLEVFMRRDSALSHNDVELELDEVDRITLYRTLKTFEESGIIHKTLDGTEKARYALCSGHCDEQQHIDDHAHFNCNRCGRTFCLNEVETPKVNLPEGYVSESSHLIIKGICDDCPN